MRVFVEHRQFLISLACCFGYDGDDDRDKKKWNTFFFHLYSRTYINYLRVIKTNRNSFHFTINTMP